jgi:hypothetical protein
VGEEGYAASVRAELSRGRYLVSLPSSDASLMALGAPVGHLVDKAALSARAIDAGLPVPPTRVFAGRTEVLDSVNDLDFPVVVKPVISRFPARRVGSPTELADSFTDDVPVIVQPFLLDQLHAVAGVVWNGRLVAAVHQRYFRTWPPDCGTACAAETIDGDPVLEERLLRVLHGYEGIFQAQLAGPHLLDLNPRVYGSLPLAVAAGVNLVAIYCSLVQAPQGGRVPGLDFKPIRARPGVFYRWIEGDVRNLWNAVRIGRLTVPKALRQLRPRRGAAHSTESLQDPKPAIARFNHALRRSGGLGRSETNGSQS